MNAISKNMSTQWTHPSGQTLAPKFFQLTPNEHFDGFVFGQNPMEPGKNNIRVNVLLQIPEKIFKDKSLFALKERWKNR